jgi:heme/copper-type cytochrome/quinol oxidase subunit 2
VRSSAWLRIGWIALAADVAYFMFGGAGALDDSGPPISSWHATLNAFLYFGGGVLLLVLLVLSYLLWRVNERARTQT